MKTLGWEQAAEWSCGVGLAATIDQVTNEYTVENGGTKTVSRINKSIYFPNENPTLRLTLSMPEKPYQVAYLANALLPYSEAVQMSPCLLWMTDFGFWSEVSERVAYSLVNCFRASRGETAPLIEKPAHLFDSAESSDAQTLLTIAIVFGWDCYIIPENASYYALTSHDEYLEVVSASPEVHASFKRELSSWGARER